VWRITARAKKIRSVCAIVDMGGGYLQVPTGFAQACTYAQACAYAGSVWHPEKCHSAEATQRCSVHLWLLMPT
jgi:hypothetical protein